MYLFQNSTSSYIETPHKIFLFFIQTTHVSNVSHWSSSFISVTSVLYFYKNQHILLNGRIFNFFIFQFKHHTAKQHIWCDITLFKSNISSIHLCTLISNHSEYISIHLCTLIQKHGLWDPSPVHAANHIECSFNKCQNAF